MSTGRTSRTVLVGVLAVLGALTAVLLSRSEPIVRRNYDGRPNVVFILTDDMRLDELRWLPAVRSLQERGVTFTHLRSSDSLCCPARATILTGKYAHNHRTLGNTYADFGGYRWFVQHNDIRDLVNTWMQRRGYRTAWVGKYLNEVRYTGGVIQPGWDAFDIPIRTVYSYTEDGYAVDGHRVRSTQYRELFNRALVSDLLGRWGGRPVHPPYLIIYSALAPHDEVYAGGARGNPPVPEPQYAGKVTESDVHPEPSVHERDLSDKPSWVRRHARTDRSPFRWRAEARRIESLMSVNDTVASIVDQVTHNGDLSHTLFIFASDNGIQLGEHGLNGKAKPYEESDRVPLVIAGPGFTGGVTRDQNVTLADVTATILRAAGDRGTHHMDGLPLQPLAADPALDHDRPILIEGTNGGLYDRPKMPVDKIGRAYEGVIWHDWSYVHYTDGENELYNLAAGPVPADQHRPAAREGAPDPAQAGRLVDRPLRLPRRGL